MPNLHMSEQERQSFLAGRHIGVMSVTRGERQPPLTTPVWYHYQPGGEITFFTATMGRTAKKTALIQDAGVLSFCVQHEEFPYKYVTVEGTVVRTDQPPTSEQVIAIVGRYLPTDQAQAFAERELGNPDSTLLLFTVRPDRWLSTDYSKLGS
jgi:nitroimidazol reductase NimA-like FMN-containing flavoprotein (pyridoxamine 5'-phosphate oxidase superfamily)